MVALSPYRSNQPRKNTTMHKFHVGTNIPGYLPDNEPTLVETLEDAKITIEWEAERYLDHLAYGLDLEDDDDMAECTEAEDCIREMFAGLKDATMNGWVWFTLVPWLEWWIEPCDDAECQASDGMW